MTRELLNNLELSGQLKPLVKAGIISTKIIFYREAAMRVEAYMLTRKLSKMEAVEQVSAEFRVNSRTILRAVAFMKAI